jgi:eukaryotic-like serine/threonine-protein kinase
MTDEAKAPTVLDTGIPVDRAATPGAPTAPDARYALVALLGKGGMGEVWLAHDQRIDREIAIKMMRSPMPSDDAIARFLREARVQGRLEHPSIVPVHDLGTADSPPFFAMKRLTGTTLASVVAEQDSDRWPRRTLLARFVDVCLAVEFAHQRGVVHRDLKPANIMLGDFGEAYVLDWGLARIAGDADPAVLGASNSHGDSGSGETEAGTMLGTLGYMSPEQARGEPVDARTDVFALGCILYEILTGAPAIDRAHVLEQTLTLGELRPSSRQPNVPPELDQLCVDATAADREHRLASARMLADRVQSFLNGDRDQELRRSLAAAHVKRAQALFDRKDEPARAAAMREAGSAIALDPANVEAQGLLARVLLEPPETMPPEVARKLDDERQDTARNIMRNTALAYTCFLLALPVMYVLGVSRAWPLVVVSCQTLALLALCLIGWLRKWRVGGHLAVAFLVLHCALLASIAMIVGPLLIVPILLFGSSTIMITVPTVRLRWAIMIGHLLAIAVPLALEWIGLVPHSYSYASGALVLTPRMIEIAPAALLYIVLGTIVLQLFANLHVLDAQREIQARSQEKLHMQAWRLGQLVSSSGSTP